MNLAANISLYAGGPGSGCNPAVGECGRREVYHGTSGANAQSILRNGIQTKVGKAYVTPDKNYAMDTGTYDSRKEKDNPVSALVVVDRDKFEQAGNKFKDEGTDNLSHPRTISPEFINRIELYKTEDLKKVRVQERGASSGSFPGAKPFRVLTR